MWGSLAKNDVAPAPAIATAGPAARHEFLPPKRHTAVSPSAGGHVNFGFVNEHAGDRCRVLGLSDRGLANQDRISDDRGSRRERAIAQGR